MIVINGFKAKPPEEAQNIETCFVSSPSLTSSSTRLSKMHCSSECLWYALQGRETELFTLV